MSTHMITEHNSFPSPLRILDSHNEDLITSPFTFGYERRDCPIIQNFVQAHNLHECIESKTNDLDRFIALNHYVAQLPNTRHNMWQDIYPWTLNQAAFHATRISDNGLDLEFSHTQPFFDHYVITIDGSSHTQTEDQLIWTLHPGENTLIVAPKNGWGDRGAESYLTIQK